MAISRRVVLKTLLATGFGGVTGTGAYGYLYERHQLGVTRIDLPVVGLPPALTGFASDCSPTSTAAAGSRTTT